MLYVLWRSPSSTAHPSHMLLVSTANRVQNTSCRAPPFSCLITPTSPSSGTTVGLIHPSTASRSLAYPPENCSPSSSSAGLGYDIVNNIARIARLFGSISSFRAYLDVSAQSPKSVLLRSELQSSGVSIIDCPHNGKKDVVDKMILGVYTQSRSLLLVERTAPAPSRYACLCPRSSHPHYILPHYW